MGLFGKSKAEKAEEKAEEERKQANLREVEEHARFLEEAQKWIDAVELHRNGAFIFNTEILQAVGELPQPGAAEENRGYVFAAEEIARHNGNVAKIEAALPSSRTEAEKAALWADYDFWLSVQNHLSALQFR